ncbi:MAG TPA: glycosyltransferase family 2 protein [Candidatus Acidoferrales bacterium]|nr:glycosyltransferase family 2 protein [Candidatus Acidoferrales bacterium]
MKFSLIVTTQGRPKEFNRLMKSLAEQSYKVLQLVVVDQSDNDRIEELAALYSSRFEVSYLRAQKCSLSHARNIGLRLASGIVIAFPDDDCWYARDTLLEVKGRFENGMEGCPALDGVSVRTLDWNGGPSCVRWFNKRCFVNYLNVWNTTISVGIFLSANLIRKTGPFDESIGVGSGGKIRSGEETDFVLRSLNVGAKILYDPKIFVHHEDNFSGASVSPKKGFVYGYGMGYVMRKNDYPFRFLGRFLVRSLGGSVLNLFKFRIRKSAIYISIATGRLMGFCQGK